MRRTTISLILLVIFLTIFIVGWSQQQPKTPLSSAAPETSLIIGSDNQSLKNEATKLAAKFAEKIDGKTLLAAKKEGRNSTAFAIMRSQLLEFKADNTEIAFIYTFEQLNGTNRFVVPLYDNPDSPKFMQVYDDSPVELKHPLKEPIGVGPYTDHWGTFVSGFAPVNTGSNETIMVLGVDIRVP
jgi:hypothetical protein